MAEVSVEINGRKFRMACEDGQETHLSSLATRFNRYIDEYKGTFGEIGDNRLVVMAGIAVVDELVEAERKIQQLSSELATVTRAGSDVAAEAESMEAKFAAKLSDVARRIESIATAVDNAGQDQPQPN
ncbi:cell division protein ZapA [Pelagibacterium luteolum]|uniref:Cell division protein ZapA n=1 Tax=Pelagibacterium luteolum TaxID=440168 RepID=A0A1G7ZBY4_9HYPH|nr:cell division protein ZapA [Pelagibacterium luteolum]SDH06261.1 cell division protein ZapA [Pelagibacterium luteolum]